MVLEAVTVLLGAAVAAIVVVYAGTRSYLGHRKTSAQTAPVASTASLTSIDSYAPTTEQAVEVPVAEAPAAAEPAPSPAPEPTPEPTPSAIYENVQPAPAPVTFSAPSPTSFGAPTLAKKPTRTYRRRTAPIRSATGVKKNLAKPKKR